MIIYVIGTILTSFLLGIANYFHNNKKNKIIEITLIILSILPLSLISGLRCGIGTDYYFTYYPNFYLVFSGHNAYTREPLFYYLNKFIQLFSADAQWLFLITSFIYMTFMTLSICKMSKNWALSIIILLIGNYYFYSMNIIRQACAISIGALAFAYSCDRKYIRTIILSLLAVGFHNSALFLFPLLIVNGIKPLYKKGYLIHLLIFAFIPLYIPLLTKLVNVIDYGAYFDPTKGDFMKEYVIVYGIIYLVSMFYYKRLINISNYSFGLMLALSFGVILSILSYRMTMESTLRLTYWFTWPLIFLLPSFTKINDNKIISYTLTIILMVILSYILIEFGYKRCFGEVLPYVDIWGHVIH